MIAKPSIAFNDFAGTAGDVTSRSVKGRTILSHKAYQDKTKTPAQAVSRNAMSKISRAYKQLTDSQMRAWEVLAGHLKGTSLFGEAASLTGHNAFVRLNANRAYIGEGLMTEAPDWHGEIPTVRFVDWCLSRDSICFTGVDDEDSKFLLVAKMTDAKSPGVSSGWGNTVILSPDRVPDWGDIDLTDAFYTMYGGGPENGKKYFIELYWIDKETGMTGVPVRVSGICGDGSQISGESMTPRTRFTRRDVVPGELDHLVTLDMEFAPGSSLISVDCQYDTKDYDVAAAKVNISEAAAARTPNFRAYVLSRTAPDKRLWPGYYEIDKWRWGRDNEISCAHRGGCFERQGIIFGTSPVFTF
jgi:hypothetical protein